MRRLLLLVSFLLPAVPALAQTGKISGVVTDESAVPLPGVNVVVLEDGDPTTTGAQTNAEGQYTILNVEPGTYDVRASFVGFATQVVEGVRVNVDLTTTVDFELQEEAVGLEEVIVQAQEPVVKPDISANVINVSSEEIENMPVTNIEEVIGLQAGVQGLNIRGGDLNEVAFIVDGFSSTDARNNTPFTGISYTSVEGVQVQTGGFSAKYGNVRSGLINVTTREGSRERYTADVLLRYSPPQQEHGGIPLNHPDGFWMRPWTDPDVAFVGTHSDASPWDVYDQRQYPRFDGFNNIAAQLASDDDPTNDLTPEQAQEIVMWTHRKDIEVKDPEYEIDGTIGGPVPGISSALGDLRFLASYRQTQNAYIVPQIRDAYQDQMGQLKLTSNIASNIKLSVLGMYAKQEGVNTSVNGGPGMFTGEGALASRLDAWNGRPIWSYHEFNPMDVTRSLIGAELTHTLDSRTFYELRLQRSGTSYNTFATWERDTTTIKVVGNTRLDEAPFGLAWASNYDFVNMRTAGDWHQARDSTEVARWTLGFNAMRQMNHYFEAEVGGEFSFNNYNVNHARRDEGNFDRNETYVWSRNPIMGAAYAQGKLEFQGMVANLGVRLDYFKATTEGWFEHAEYEPIFSTLYPLEDLEALPTEPVPAQLSLSPRLGVSFPVTENSKLFFNYGHFRQMLVPTDLFESETDFFQAVTHVGNPYHPLPRTVAYELGFEQGLSDMFLLRVMGYYKALGDQSRNVTFVSADGYVNYTVPLPFNYEDIRGFELTLQKNRGRWIRGFVNYTYMVTKEGNFGFSQYHESTVQQRQYEREYTGHYQSLPIPRPYARANIEFLVPPDFGPEWGGTSPLGDWRLSLLGRWIAGNTFTWSGEQGNVIAGLRNNVQYRGQYDLDLRISRNFDTALGQLQLFADVNNVLNLKTCCGFGFEGERDFDYYMQSLHLPEDIFDDIEGDAPYLYIPGDDKPGDFRSYDTEFVPIEIVTNVQDVGNPLERPLYYEWDSRRYMSYANGEWSEADPNRVDEVLEDKAYIDMPNQRSLVFLDPRRVRFGLRVTL